MIRTVALFSLALAAPAGAFELAFPVDCTLGQTCHIQQYYDHDPSASAQDFNCAGLSYDGHDGTDFGLATRTDMAKGVNVLAAAGGTVKGIRDGVADFAPVEPNRECGNGVLIDHGGGWETQYCHLKQGSIIVRVGDDVAPGTTLGQIGQSGMAAFPHLHLSVRRNGVEVDPFSPKNQTCGAKTDDLWMPEIPYQPGGLLDIGITSAIPEYDAIKAGLPSPDLPANAPALVIWAYVFGTRAGDALILSITGPAGEVITDRVSFEKNQAQAFRAIGRKLKTDQWPTGVYNGTVKMMRGAIELGQQKIALTVAP